MVTLTNKAVEITARGSTIAGIVNGNEQVWDFRSEDPDFLKMCPSGSILSFSMYGKTDVLSAHRALHSAVASKVAELLEYEDNAQVYP